MAFQLTGNVVLLPPSNLGQIRSQISGALRGFGSASGGIADANKQLENFGRQAGLAARRFVAFSAAAGSLYRFTRALQSGFREAVSFERELVKIKQLGDTTNAGIKSIADEVGRLSTSLGVSSSQLVETARTFRQAGFSINEVKTALEAVAQAALAPNFGSLEDTVEGSIAVMRQFDLEARQLQSTLGSINAVASAFAVDASDITQAIQRAGGAFRAAGGNAEELVALFTSVRSTTRESASSIATGLRTIFTRLQRNSTVEALEQLGVNLRRTREEALAFGDVNLEGQFVGAYEAIRRISEGLRDIPTTSPQFARIVEQIGGFRQVSRVIPLIREFGTAQRALSVAQTGSQSLQGSASIAAESLEVKLSRLNEQFLRLSRDVINSPGFQVLANTFLDIASAVGSVLTVVKPLIPLLTALAVTSAFKRFGSFAKGFSSNFFNRPLNGNPNQSPPLRFAQGGLIPGSGGVDDTPIMATRGEFIFNKQATRNIGPQNLEALQSIAQQGGVKKLASGGLVNIRRSKGVPALLYLDEKDNKGRVQANLDIAAIRGESKAALRLLQGEASIEENKKIASTAKAKLRSVIPRNAQKLTPEMQEFFEKEGILQNGRIANSFFLNEKARTQFNIGYPSLGILKQAYVGKQIVDQTELKGKALSAQKGIRGISASINTYPISPKLKQNFDKDLRDSLGDFIVKAAGDLNNIKNLSIPKNRVAEIVRSAIQNQGVGRIFEGVLQVFANKTGKSQGNRNFDFQPKEITPQLRQIFDFSGTPFADAKISNSRDNINSVALKALRQFGLATDNNNQVKLRTLSDAAIKGRKSVDSITDKELLNLNRGGFLKLNYGDSVRRLLSDDEIANFDFIRNHPTIRAMSERLRSASLNITKRRVNLPPLNDRDMAALLGIGAPASDALEQANLTKPLTPEELVAVRKHSFKFDKINRYLRTGNVPGFLQRQASLLDSAISKTAAPRGNLLFRGFDKSRFNLNDPGFLSFSSDAGKAFRFATGAASRTQNPNPLLLALGVPTGLPGIGTGAAGISAFGNAERETLLPRNLRLREIDRFQTNVEDNFSFKPIEVASVLPQGIRNTSRRRGQIREYFELQEMINRRSMSNVEEGIGYKQDRVLNSLQDEFDRLRKNFDFGRFSGGGSVRERMIRGSTLLKNTPGSFKKPSSGTYPLFKALHRELIDEVPEGAELLATGTEAAVFRLPNGNVMRIAGIGENASRSVDPVSVSRGFEGRPAHSRVVQPVSSKVKNNFLVEELPFVESLASLEQRGVLSERRRDFIIDALENRFKKEGLRPIDFIDDNIGIQDGKVKLIDPNSFVEANQGRFINQRARDLRSQNINIYDLLERYTGSAYSGINNRLRNDPQLTTLDDDHKLEFIAGTNALTKYLNKPLRGHSSLFRGVRLGRGGVEDNFISRAIGNPLNSIDAIGSIFQDPAFLSTSLDRNIAEEFAFGKNRDKSGLLIQIDDRGFTKGQDISRFSDYRESEILLQRNSPLRIENFDSKTRTLFTSIVSRQAFNRGGYLHANRGASLNKKDISSIFKEFYNVTKINPTKFINTVALGNFSEAQVFEDFKNKKRLSINNQQLDDFDSIKSLALRQIARGIIPGYEPNSKIITDGGDSELFLNDNSIGYLSLGPNSLIERHAARNIFPKQVNKNNSVGRIFESYVDEDFRGRGFGQRLYLEGLANSGLDFIYNSQAEKPAQRALTALDKKGLINSYFRSDGGKHIANITESGKSILKLARGFNKGGYLHANRGLSITSPYIPKSASRTFVHPIQKERIAAPTVRGQRPFQDDILPLIENSPFAAQILSQLAGTHLIGEGSEAGVFRVNDSTVRRVGDLSTFPRALDKVLRGEIALQLNKQNISPQRAAHLRNNLLFRPNIPEMLQAIPGTTQRFGNFIVEDVPYATPLRNSGLSYNEQDAISAMLAQRISGRGLDPFDVAPRNIGLVGGNPFIIDPGAIARRSFNSGGIVTKENINNILKEFQQITGVNASKFIKKIKITNQRGLLNTDLAAKPGASFYAGFFPKTQTILLDRDKFESIASLRSAIFHEISHGVDLKSSTNKNYGSFKKDSINEKFARKAFKSGDYDEALLSSYNPNQYLMEAFARESTELLTGRLTDKKNFKRLNTIFESFGGKLNKKAIRQGYKQYDKPTVERPSVFSPSNLINGTIQFLNSSISDVSDIGTNFKAAFLSPKKSAKSNKILSTLARPFKFVDNQLNRFADFLDNSQNDPISRFSRFLGFNTGGFVPGVGNRDTHFTTLPEGSFVLRKEVSQKLNRGGQVPVALTPGERVFSPREVNQIGVARLRLANQTGDTSFLGLNKGGYAGYSTGDIVHVKDGEVGFTGEFNSLGDATDILKKTFLAIGKDVQIGGKFTKDYIAALKKLVADLKSQGFSKGDRVTGRATVDSKGQLIFHTDRNNPNAAFQNIGKTSQFVSGTQALESVQREVLAERLSKSQNRTIKSGDLERELGGKENVKLALAGDTDSLQEARNRLAKIFLEQVKLGNTKLTEEQALIIAMQKLGAVEQNMVNVVQDATGQIQGVANDKTVLTPAQAARAQSVDFSKSKNPRVQELLNGPDDIARQQLAEQKKATRQRNLQLFVQGLGTVASSAAPIIAGGADARTAVEAGESGSFQTRQTLSSGLTGASVGAAAGSAFGLPGTIIGGVLGALRGLITGFVQANEAIAKAKLDKSLAALASNIENINRRFEQNRDISLNTLQNAQTNLNDVADEADAFAQRRARRENSIFGFGLLVPTSQETLDSSARRIAGGELSPVLAAAQQNLVLQARAIRRDDPSASIDEIIERLRANANNETVINRIAANQQISSGDFVNQQLRGQIADATREQVLRESNNVIRELIARFNILTGEIAGLTETIQATNQSILAQASVIQGSPAQIQTSQLSSNILGTSRFSDIVSGSFGNNPRFATLGIANALSASNLLIQELPGIIGQVRAESGGSLNSDSIRTRVQDLLNARGIDTNSPGVRSFLQTLFQQISTENANPEIAELLTNGNDVAAVNAILTEQTTGLISSFNNLQATLQNTTESANQLVSALIQAEQRIVELNFNRDSLVLQERESRVAFETPIRSEQLRRISLDEALAPITNRRNTLLRNADLGINASVDDVAEAFFARQREINNVTNQLSNNPNLADAPGLRNRLQDLTITAANLNAVLQDYANVQQNTSAIQERLNSLREEETNRFRVAETLLTADAQTIARSRFGMQQALAADRSGVNIAELSRFQRTRIFEALQLFSGTQVNDNGRNVNVDQLRRRLLERTGLGLNANQQNQAQNLQERMNQAFADGQAALRALSQVQTNLGENIEQALVSAQTRFLTQFREILTLSERSSINAERSNALTRLGTTNTRRLALERLRASPNVMSALSALFPDGNLEALNQPGVRDTIRNNFIGRNNAINNRRSLIDSIQNGNLQRFNNFYGLISGNVIDQVRQLSRGPSQALFTSRTQSAVDAVTQRLFTTGIIDHDTLQNFQLNRERITTILRDEEPSDRIRAARASYNEAHVTNDRRRMAQATATLFAEANFEAEIQRVNEVFSNSNIPGLANIPTPVLRNLMGPDGREFNPIVQQAIDIGQLTNLNQLQQVIGNLDEELTRLRRTIDNLSLRLSQLSAIPVQTNAAGGIIPNLGNTGIRVGTDTVPALLTPGEFVVNAAATRRHLPLLQEINMQRFQEGGPVGFAANPNDIPSRERYITADRSFQNAHLALSPFIATQTVLDRYNRTNLTNLPALPLATVIARMLNMSEADISADNNFIRPYFIPDANILAIRRQFINDVGLEQRDRYQVFNQGNIPTNIDELYRILRPNYFASQNPQQQNITPLEQFERFIRDTFQNDIANNAALFLAGRFGNNPPGQYERFRRLFSLPNDNALLTSRLYLPPYGPARTYNNIASVVQAARTPRMSDVQMLDNQGNPIVNIGLNPLGMIESGITTAINRNSARNLEQQNINNMLRGNINNLLDLVTNFDEFGINDNLRQQYPNLNDEQLRSLILQTRRRYNLQGMNYQQRNLLALTIRLGLEQDSTLNNRFLDPNTMALARQTVEGSRSDATPFELLALMRRRLGLELRQEDSQSIEDINRRSLESIFDVILGPPDLDSRTVGSNPIAFLPPNIANRLRPQNVDINPQMVRDMDAARRTYSARRQYGLTGLDRDRLELAVDTARDYNRPNLLPLIGSLLRDNPEITRVSQVRDLIEQIERRNEEIAHQVNAVLINASQTRDFANQGRFARSRNTLFGTSAFAGISGLINQSLNDRFNARNERNDLRFPARPDGEYATGGLIPGVGNKDTHLALTTPGEFIVNKSAVQKIGVPTLHAINQGEIPRFQAGGLVGAIRGNSNQSTPQPQIDLSGSISLFNQSVNVFQTATERLSQALSSIPESIELNGNHRVEVIINGAEVLQQLGSNLEEFIIKRVDDALTNFIKDKNPDIGLV